MVGFGVAGEVLELRCYSLAWKGFGIALWMLPLGSALTKLFFNSVNQVLVRLWALSVAFV